MRWLLGESSKGQPDLACAANYNVKTPDSPRREMMDTRLHSICNRSERECFFKRVALQSATMASSEESQCQILSSVVHILSSQKQASKYILGTLSFLAASAAKKCMDYVFQVADQVSCWRSLSGEAALAGNLVTSKKLHAFI